MPHIRYSSEVRADVLRRIRVRRLHTKLSPRDALDACPLAVGVNRVRRTGNAFSTQGRVNFSIAVNLATRMKRFFDSGHALAAFFFGRRRRSGLAMPPRIKSTAGNL